jgi:putative transcriptional regulator
MTMMTMPQHPTHHPSDERLLDYVSGAASEPVSLVIATHLALCPRCRHETRELESLGGALLDDLPAESLSPDCMDRMLARIERPEPLAEPVKPEPAASVDPSIPEPLRGYLDRPVADLPWRRRGAIAEVSLLPNIEDHATRLFWICAGAAVPQHTHKGSELTLVLKGSFEDAHGRYVRGDVEEADSEIDHRPIAGEEEDCLCLAVTDAPLKLTSPLGRLINPFVRM